MIGILGGTFDPIHHGHLRIALEVADALALSQVRFIPNRIPPHRPQPVASGAARLAMLRSAIAHEPRFVVDDYELRQATTSYTLHTLQALHAAHPRQQWVLILGVDAFLNFTQWYQWETILTLTHVVVVERPQYTLESSPTAWYTPYLVDSVAALQQQRVGGILPLAIKGMDISATQIRLLLAQARSPRYLIPEVVWDMMQTQHWYQAKKKV